MEQHHKPEPILKAVPKSCPINHKNKRISRLHMLHNAVPWTNTKISATQCGLDSGELAMLRISTEAPGYLHVALHCAMLPEERAHDSTLLTCTSDGHQAWTGWGISNPYTRYVRTKVGSSVSCAVPPFPFTELSFIQLWATPWLSPAWLVDWEFLRGFWLVCHLSVQHLVLWGTPLREEHPIIESLAVSLHILIVLQFFVKAEKHTY